LLLVLRGSVAGFGAGVVWSELVEALPPRRPRFLATVY
jgi:hypothetical protein